MKLVHAPHLGRHVVVGGRRRPKSYARRLQFSMLREASVGALPTPPDAADFASKAAEAMRQLWLNDRLGDCVPAGRARRIGVLTASAGAPFVYTDAQVLSEYERIGGYVPGNDSSDQGCDMSSSADDGVSHGYADGSHDLAWVDVDATNKLDVMRSLFLFGHGDLGIELPDAWIDPFPNDGDTWDVAGEPDPENGHCVELVGYNAKGVLVATWGIKLTMTWAALAKYGARSAFGELIVHLSPDEIERASQKAPNTFDWSALIGYFNGMGGRAPVPAPVAPPQPKPTPTPAPPPSPTPAPGYTVTLADAQRWARAGIAKAPRGVVTATLAGKLATEGLADHWPKA